PSILILMTSFTRIVIVLSFTRTALATNQTPPNQVIIGLALFLTFFIMAPTFQQVNDEALQPLFNEEIGLEEAYSRA
ncbi:flagellar type III secretion system pore protein FliP, partial [Klebsiella pneumoniae]